LTCIEPVTPVYVSKSLKTAPSVEYGTYTAPPNLATAFAGLALKPRYLIEPFMVDGKNYYRITVRGYGVNIDTQVTLQEIYYKE
jgi:Tfp pilus assembly protein PilX